MEVRGPFPIQALRAWVATSRKRKTVRELRDPALVAVGIRCMRRPGELTELRVRHVRPFEKGIKIFLAKSKTDQTMEGRWMHVDEVPGSRTCPVMLLRRYLDSRGKLGPNDVLFANSNGGAISSSAVSSIVKNMCSAAGLADKVSGHSLRIAGATLGLKGGLTLPEICAVGGWKSEAVLRYLRDCAVAQNGGSSRMGF
jgi:site-specific recombinase XerD